MVLGAEYMYCDIFKYILIYYSMIKIEVSIHTQKNRNYFIATLVCIANIGEDWEGRRRGRKGENEEGEGGFIRERRGRKKRVTSCGEFNTVKCRVTTFLLTK